MPRVLVPEHPRPSNVEPSDTHPRPVLRGAIVLPAPPLTPLDEGALRSLSVANPGWRFEIGCDGELVVNMHAGGDSPFIGGIMVRHVGNWGAGGGGRTGPADTGYWLGGGPRQKPLMQPDVSWVSPDQIAELSADEMLGAYPVCPPFVVEIRSPTDKLVDQQEKMETWLHFGVQLGWLIDPQAETVWLYRPDQDPEQLERPTALSGEDVLVGLTVDMSEVWALVDESKQKADSD